VKFDDQGEEVGMLRYLSFLQSLRDSLDCHVNKAKQHSAYGVLGISETATDAEVRQAFRDRAREAHPDRGGTKEEFRAIRAAYEQILRERQTSGHAPDPEAEKKEGAKGRRESKTSSAAGGESTDEDPAAAEELRTDDEAGEESSAEKGEKAERESRGRKEKQSESSEAGEEEEEVDKEKKPAEEDTASDTHGGGADEEPSAPGRKEARPNAKESAPKTSGSGEDVEAACVAEVTKAAELASECAQLVARLRRAARHASTRSNLRSLALQALSLSLKTVGSLKTISEHATTVARSAAPLAKWRPEPGTDPAEATALMSGQADLLQLTVRCQERSAEVLRLAQEVPQSLESALGPLVALSGDDISLLGEARVELALERASRVVGNASSAALAAAMSAADVKMAADAFRQKLKGWEKRKEHDRAEREERARREEEVAEALRAEKRKQQEQQQRDEEEGKKNPEPEAAEDRDKGKEESEAQQGSGKTPDRSDHNRQLLRKLNSELLRQQRAVKQLMKENNAAIPDVSIAEKSRLFTLVTELVEKEVQAVKSARTDEGWVGVVERIVALIHTATTHDVGPACEVPSVAVPSLAARLLRLAALIDVGDLGSLLDRELCNPVDIAASAGCVPNATRIEAARSLRNAIERLRGFPLAP